MSAVLHAAPGESLWNRQRETYRHRQMERHQTEALRLAVWMHHAANIKMAYTVQAEVQTFAKITGGSWSLRMAAAFTNSCSNLAHSGHLQITRKQR